MPFSMIRSRVQVRFALLAQDVQSTISALKVRFGAIAHEYDGRGAVVIPWVCHPARVVDGVLLNRPNFSVRFAAKTGCGALVSPQRAFRAFNERKVCPACLKDCGRPRLERFPLPEETVAELQRRVAGMTGEDKGVMPFFAAVYRQGGGGENESRGLPPRLVQAASSFVNSNGIPTPLGLVKLEEGQDVPEGVLDVFMITGKAGLVSYEDIDRMLPSKREHYSLN